MPAVGRWTGGTGELLPGCPCQFLQNAAVVLHASTCLLIPWQHTDTFRCLIDPPATALSCPPCCSAQYGEAAWLAAGAPGDGDSAEAEDGSRDGSYYDQLDTASDAPLPAQLPGGPRTLARPSPFQN